MNPPKIIFAENYSLNESKGIRLLDDHYLIMSDLSLHSNLNLSAGNLLLVHPVEYDDLPACLFFFCTMHTMVKGTIITIKPPIPMPANATMGNPPAAQNRRKKQVHERSSNT